MHLCCRSQSRHCLMFFASLPLYSVMFQQRSSNSLLQLCEICVTLLYFSSLFRSIRFLRAFPFRIDFGVCLFVYCVVCPPSRRHFFLLLRTLFSAVALLCALAYFSLFVLSIGYSPQFFMVVRVIAVDSPSNHLQNQLWPSNLAQLLCYYCIKYISKYKHIYIVDKGRNKIGIGN